MKKFRAWDPQTNHMHYPPNEHIYMNIDGTCVNFQNGETLEVMFWTEKIDRNGKDIYDCDVLKYHTKSIAVVYYDKDHFRYRVLAYKDETGSLSNFGSGSNCEVVGNLKQHKIEDFQ